MHNCYDVGSTQVQFWPGAARGVVDYNFVAFKYRNRNWFFSDLILHFLIYLWIIGVLLYAQTPLEATSDNSCNMRCVQCCRLWAEKSLEKRPELFSVAECWADLHIRANFNEMEFWNGVVIVGLLYVVDFFQQKYIFVSFSSCHFPIATGVTNCAAQRCC